eukprot:CAMPEP_0115834602 /NCGR_PEP_ID=MMETSP0287-20121206/3767_1 /TAXON_ID=412157 /ORGANISM="Chrysochromulina rotalis, Strain UIO044" /LENGTH=51 /DNA_ID=CAMNT_0003288041 /DNA_START=428 /DNA_END=579 /DNA_ORIENTATION=-
MSLGRAGGPGPIALRKVHARRCMIIAAASSWMHVPMSAPKQEQRASPWRRG